MLIVATIAALVLSMGVLIVQHIRDDNAVAVATFTGAAGARWQETTLAELDAEIAEYNAKARELAATRQLVLAGYAIESARNLTRRRAHVASLGESDLRRLGSYGAR